MVFKEDLPQELPKIFGLVENIFPERESQEA